MKKIIITIVVFCATSPIYAQIAPNIKDIFKMHLFLNSKKIEIISLQNQNNVDKYDNVYNIDKYAHFDKIIDLKLDTLDLKNNKYDNSLSKSFKFFKLDINNITVKLAERSNYEVTFISGACSYYILCVNIKTGMSYKLYGFNTNDFLSFLVDFKKESKQTEYEKLSTKKFMRLYSVEGLNFKCIYKTLKKADMYSKKRWSCTVDCNEDFRIH